MKCLPLPFDVLRDVVEIRDGGLGGCLEFRCLDRPLVDEDVGVFEVTRHRVVGGVLVDRDALDQPGVREVAAREGLDRDRVTIDCAVLPDGRPDRLDDERREVVLFGFGPLAGHRRRRDRFEDIRVVDVEVHRHVIEDVLDVLACLLEPGGDRCRVDIVVE